MITYKEQIVTETTKSCTRCDEIKDHSLFHKDKKNVKGKGLAYYCKDCANKKTRDYNTSNKYNEEYRRKKKNGYIKNRFNISLDIYETLLKEQGYSCGICKITLPPSGYFTHLDHDHATGKLRKFLCTNCNRGLGHFQDNKEFLMSAVKYLEAHTDDGNQKEGTGL
jgi:hypothetical protein